MPDDGDASRDLLMDLEAGLCDLQDMAAEAKLEMTATLLRMALLDVRKAMGFKRPLDG